MLLRTMCVNFLLLTQFYPYCTFETQSRKLYAFKYIYVPQCNVFTFFASDANLSSVSIKNLELGKYFHLSINILFRAMCQHIMLLKQFCPQCQLKPLSRKLLLFKHIHAPKGNVITHGASNANLSLLCI